MGEVGRWGLQVMGEGWGLRVREGRPLAQTEDEDSYVCMNRHWSSLSSRFLHPLPPLQHKMTPYSIWWGIFTHEYMHIHTHTHTDKYTYPHTHTHILFSWSDDIINNHYWDTRKCRDLRLRVWLHGIRLAWLRWEIWKGKHPPKLFYFWISSMPQCYQKVWRTDGRIQQKFPVTFISSALCILGFP